MLFVYVRLIQKREEKLFSVTISSLNPPRNLLGTAKQSSTTKTSNQSHSREWASKRENNERFKIIDENKNNHEKFSFCLCVFFDTAQKSSTTKKLLYRKCIWKFFGRHNNKTAPTWLCLCVSPIFHSAETKKNCRRCVWQPENVYNHLKYITVEYKRHYANRTYFCHFPS